LADANDAPSVFGGNKGGRPEFQPTDEQRERVADMVAVGITYEQIAAVIGIAEGTLTKHFAHELATAKAEANAKVGKSLFVRAVNGDTSAAIWWTKAQMGWKERKDVDLSSSDGSMTPKPGIDASKLSTEALREIMAAKDADSAD